jgi:hypothetical protein
MNLEKMSKNELIELLNGGMWDQHTGFLLGNFASVVWGELPAGKAAVFIDFCNAHAGNHKFTMAGQSARWTNSISLCVRPGDKITKWGGDEFVVILDSSDAAGFVARCAAECLRNEVHAVFAVVTTSNDLRETVNRADTIAMAEKRRIEAAGEKQGRDEAYKCGRNYFVSA